ncbi:MAG: hypothetical protein HY262_04850 [Chloroflexi bacterium]|nr:hypothetical protein [Chloroflexota bacterium]
MTGRSQPALARLRSPWLALERTAENLADLGVVFAGTLWFVVVFLAMPFGRVWQTGQEAFCYWIANLNSPYSLSNWGSPIAYVYSPAFLQAILPLTHLPWMLFMTIWTGLLIAAVRYWAAVPIPLVVRFPVAVAVVVWGARSNRRWTVPVAAMLALPALWYGSLTMLLGVIALRDPDRNEGSLQASSAASTQSATA